jgi:hypothetical protein
VPDAVPSIAEPPALIAVSAVLPLLWFRWRCCFERDRRRGTHWRARSASLVMMAGQDVVETFFFDHAQRLLQTYKKCSGAVPLQ